MNNELENKIKEIKDKIESIEMNKSIVNAKNDKLRKFIISNTIIAAFMNIIGFLTHPLITVFALSFLLLSILPSGIIIFHYQDKEEKYQKEIDFCNEEIKNIEKKLNNIVNEENVENIPLTPNQLSSKKVITPKKNKANKIIKK